MGRPDASGMKAALMAARVAVLTSAAFGAQAAPPSPTRGELLYTTHCIACHNSQMHWRDQRLATDWASLRGQVRRWQGVANLGWSEDDILEVARHLNERIYRYPVSGDKVVSQRAESSIGH